jgi:hypothetical protein
MTRHLQDQTVCSVNLKGLNTVMQVFFCKKLLFIYVEGMLHIEEINAKAYGK